MGYIRHIKVGSVEAISRTRDRVSAGEARALKCLTRLRGLPNVCCRPVRCSSDRRLVPGRPDSDDSSPPDSHPARFRAGPPDATRAAITCDSANDTFWQVSELSVRSNRHSRVN